MIYLRFTIFSFVLLLVSSCSTPKNLTVVKKHKVREKIEVCKSKKSLYQGLKDIDANIGDDIFLRIFKQERELELWVRTEGKYKLCKVYPICSYSGGLGPKLKQGDKQAPEGFYKVSKRQLKPNSKYHLAFNLGFPNKYDKNLGRTGSYLMVHGKCSSTGCYAMGDSQIEEIYKMAEASLDDSDDSFDVHIFPFRMTQQNMNSYQASEWFKFWKNLKLGYDIFERYGVVPIIKSPQDIYRFYVNKGII
jgi:murein L,D-transpeptidase YafK